MPDRDQWRSLITAQYKARPEPVRMATFLARFGTASTPVKFIGEDGETYLVKGRHNGRMIVNEQIVGALGVLIGAPVAPPVFADVPQELISAEPELSFMEPGVSHATVWLEDCTDRQGIAYVDVPENKARFAQLAVLYTWAHAGDHQWIYKVTQPNLVYSVDHGHFFPGGPTWSTTGLRSAPDPILDPQFAACGLSATDFGDVRARLEITDEEGIAKVLARPWHNWAITEEERIDMAIFVDERRHKVLQLLA